MNSFLNYKSHLILLVILAVNLSFLPEVFSADETPSMKRLKVSSTSPEEEGIINEGIKLHDQGKYEEAIMKYEQVLEMNTDNVFAIYEIAYSYNMMKDHKKSLKYAKMGMEYNSSFYHGVAMIAGNNLDDMGQPEEAIKIYKEAISFMPDESLLHFNLGITYYKMKKKIEAEDSFIKAVELNPYHPSSHFLLANIYFEEMDRIPLLYTLTTFLYLEPNTVRTNEALKMLNQTIGSYVHKSDSNTFNINVNMNDDDTFSAADLMVGMSLTKCLTEKSTIDIPCVVDAYKMAPSLNPDKEGKSSTTNFVLKHYSPFFKALYDEEYTDVFIYCCLESSGMEEVKNWLRTNIVRVEAFRGWFKEYSWE